MSHPIEKVVAEFVVRLDELDHSVKGRVTEVIIGDDREFRTEVSHYCRPTAAASNQHRHSLKAKTQEDAERHVRAYLSVFTAIDVEPNKYY